MVWLGWAGLKMASLSIYIYIVRVRSKLQKCSPIWYSIDMLWHFPRFPLVSHLFFNDVFFSRGKKSRFLRVSAHEHPTSTSTRKDQRCGKRHLPIRLTLSRLQILKSVWRCFFCFAKNGGNMMFQTTPFFFNGSIWDMLDFVLLFFFGGWYATNWSLLNLEEPTNDRNSLAAAVPTADPT